MNIFILLTLSILTQLENNIEYDIAFYNRLKAKADSAYIYCKEHQYNPDIFLLFDAKIHSGKKRFFIYDYKHKTILKSSLCSHGCGDSLWASDKTKTCPVFSNVPESHCSSLGKYKVGKRGYSNWGINVNYRLHGLEKTNSNANARDVVLHSWYDIPEEECFPEGCPEGWGCPAVSNEFMTALDSILTKNNKPILLWIYH